MRSVDGRLHGLDAHSGKELWSVEQQVPRLSLRGTATPIIAKDVAISGFDNGKVMAVSLNSGDTVWDTALASPHGRTELDRLVDIDSAVRTVGDNVFATGFQGRTAMLALDSGQIWWAHDMSSYRGLAVDADNLYVTQSDGIVVALRQRDGSELWRNQKLKLRRLTTPVADEHRGGRGRLPRLFALAGQEHRRARGAGAGRQGARYQCRRWRWAIPWSC